jgi:MoxR-like ATPase
VIADLRARLITEVRKAVVGQDQAIDVALLALCTGGHVLLEGVPGTAKTLLASAVSKALGLDFRRVQFTPDMLPSDLTGTMTLAGGQLGELSFRPGPLFAQVVLADEINRTPPKTQAALLEAMGEGQISVDGVTHRLPVPFMVLATQNPIEQEGTYPLPEAQLDRFAVKLVLDYPSADAEVAMLSLPRSGVGASRLDAIQMIVRPGEIEEIRREADSTRITPDVMAYVVAVVRSTRSVPAVLTGASPRAAVHLLAMAKAFARLSNRDYVTPDDVAILARPVLRHRIVLRPEAELERYQADDAVNAAIASTPVPR